MNIFIFGGLTTKFQILNIPVSSNESISQSIEDYERDSINNKIKCFRFNYQFRRLG
jgi:hypothetical protein